MAKLYEAKEGDKPILEDIARLTIADRRVEVETLFGERKVFQGKVRQIDFLKSQIQLEKD
ncbi:MAG TPA: CooT family nickel-binding protein [Dehalococcoidia bacterium]|nr:CooT family nickel-binding protein [Dehalococcoidia bacterium]